MPLDCQIMHGCQVSMSCTCAQAQDLAQNHCGNNCEGIYIYIHIYIYIKYTLWGY